MIIHDEWLYSIERKEALEIFMGDFALWDVTSDDNDPDHLIIPFGASFRDSSEFANARNEFKKRVNSQWPKSS